jgi:alkylated DNA repair dioxygenase AlkB/SAM-dependent methyltransferase
LSTHPCQVTMITTKPLYSGCENSCWPRSNPPKFRRLLHDHIDQVERSQTRFVYVTGLVDINHANLHTSARGDGELWFGNDHLAMLQAMRRVLGQEVEIFLPGKMKKTPDELQQQSSFMDVQSCHLGFRTAQDAQRIVESLQGQTVQWEHPSSISNSIAIQSSRLFLDYATITQKCKAKQARDAGLELGKGEPSRPECTSSTNHVTVPGLVVLEDYITIEQEQVLMAVLTGPQAPWAPQQRNKSQTGAVKRKVQHYGYVFDYQTADVLRDRTITSSTATWNPANCPPLPVISRSSMENTDADAFKNELVQEGKGWNVLACLIEKIRRYNFRVADEKSMTQTHTYPNINQLTVNQYMPGEGIGSHIDTPSAFGDGLISISLNSGIVMEFRKVGHAIPALKKLVYLPSRSLVLMSGPARYEWEHQIVTRRTDTHNGVVIQRGLRVSLTLRTALSLDGTPMPRVQSNHFPPRWDGPESKAAKNALATPMTERDHVHAVYDAIATQWHHTRGKRGVLWPGATQFLQRLTMGSIVADVGCGDGKYFPAIWEAGSFVIGTDISRPLLETAFQANFGEKIADTRKVSPHRQDLQTRPAVAVGDCMSLPFRSKSFDAAICIAVMHHLSTQERRIRCIEELTRIVKSRGRINVQAWAMEQDQDSRRRFAAKDVFVPFNAQPKYLNKVKTINGGITAASLESHVLSKSVAELYSEAYENSDYDEKKGLVVFQRYCHLYLAGELEEIVAQVKGVRLVESGYESGNHFVILEVI